MGFMDVFSGYGKLWKQLGVISLELFKRFIRDSFLYEGVNYFFKMTVLVYLTGQIPTLRSYFFTMQIFYTVRYTISVYNYIKSAVSGLLMIGSITKDMREFNKTFQSQGIDLTELFGKKNE